MRSSMSNIASQFEPIPLTKRIPNMELHEYFIKLSYGQSADNRPVVHIDIQKIHLSLPVKDGLWIALIFVGVSKLDVDFTRTQWTMSVFNLNKISDSCGSSSFFYCFAGIMYCNKVKIFSTTSKAKSHVGFLRCRLCFLYTRRIISSAVNQYILVIFHEHF